MTNLYEQYLTDLEERAKKSDLNDLYLWPRTPIAPDHQDKILERCGATDYEIENPKSRPYKVLNELKYMIENNMLKKDFSIVDITSGDTIVLWQVKKTFTDIFAYGVDCLKDKFSTHEEIYKSGVKIYEGYIQHMFTTPVKEKFDIAIMFNAYRGWESADLRDCEKDLPQLADKWFEKNCRFTFLTAKLEKIKELEDKGFNIKIIGNGEDDSMMFVMSKELLN